MDQWDMVDSAAVRARLHAVMDAVPTRGLAALLAYLEEVVKGHQGDTEDAEE
jgi:hypothetical protein